jgi:2-keto-4-pentenoate hydratase/2-oxohepta-3-ene-1,7-dioic acid hydratase in catechol pathway
MSAHPSTARRGGQPLRHNRDVPGRGSAAIHAQTAPHPARTPTVEGEENLMKLLTFHTAPDPTPRFGALLSGDRVLDLVAADSGVPRSLLQCIRQGDAGLAAVRKAVSAAEAALARGDAPTSVLALAGATLDVPFRPGKIMAVGRNYADHVAEGAGAAYSRVAGFIKLTNGLVAHGATVVKPAWTEQWDYENELAVVIGRDCVDVPPEQAYEVVFGYTILNDISARDVQMAERKEGNICIGKNFPTAAPMGPWVVTRDEIPDPHALRIVTRVNGEVRQDATTDRMIYNIPAQIAWYSHAGFEPGDVISTGTPSGVGLGYKGPGTWYLQHGDRIECEVERIGVLVNTCRDPKRG